MLDVEKTFYSPGELVKIRHTKLENVPIMWVVEKVSKPYFNKETGTTESIFSGIKCRWFNKNQELCESLFSSKDLEHVN